MENVRSINIGKEIISINHNGRVSSISVDEIPIEIVITGEGESSKCVIKGKNQKIEM